MKFETKSHPLKCPVKVEVATGEGENVKSETVELTEVTLTTPKGKKMREIMRMVSRVEAMPLVYSDGDMVMDSIQVMSDMPEGGIDALHPADVTALGKIAAPFLESVMGGDPTSESSPDGTVSTSTK